MREHKSNYPVVCLCGSTKFKDDFIEAYEELSKRGCIVLTVGMFGHADNRYEKDLTEEVKITLDVMHFEKILMSDAVLIINKDGYVGYSTKREIEFANHYNIPVLNLYEEIYTSTFVPKSYNSDTVDESFDNNFTYRYEKYDMDKLFNRIKSRIIK